MISDKEQTWQGVANTIARTTDSIGAPVDPGIRETVIALNALDIPTLASCEGHLDHGAAAPWIDVGDPAARPLAKEAFRLSQGAGDKEQTEQARLAAFRLNLAVRRRLLALLDQFYADRCVSADIRLIINPAEWSGISRLESQGAAFQMVAESDERAHILASYQDEMSAFAAFLKAMFFDEAAKTPPLLYTTAEAAAVLGVLPNTVTHYVQRGLITAEKSGRDYFIAPDEVARFQRERRRSGRPSGG